MKIYIGTQPNPEDRLIIEVKDVSTIPPRGSRKHGVLTDDKTGAKYHVRRASCGLPNCLCALELVD